jgi:hypothetical protein
LRALNRVICFAEVGAGVAAVAGVNAGTLSFALADRTEQRSGRPSSLAAGFWQLLGH